jgi:hypothetical protein
VSQHPRLPLDAHAPGTAPVDDDNPRNTAVSRLSTEGELPSKEGELLSTEGSPLSTGGRA